MEMMQVLVQRTEWGTYVFKKHIHLIQSDSDKGLYGAHNTRLAVLCLAGPAGVLS